MANKCAKGYRYQDGKCVKYITKVNYKDGLETGNKVVRTFALGMLILLGFLFAVNLKNTDVLWALGINIFFVLVAYMSFGSKELQDSDIDIVVEKNVPKTLVNWGKLFMWGFVFVIAFYIVTRFVPGLQIGYPQLPGDISGSFKWFIINIVSPISETLFFLGTVFAFFNKLSNKKHKLIALFLASILFASFHLGAYIFQIYTYPSFTSTMSVVWANISSFITAFLFNMVAGSFMLIGTDNEKQKYRKNLIFAIIFHFGLNFIATSLSVVVFA